jgi:hypothetical protein
MNAVYTSSLLENAGMKRFYLHTTYHVSNISALADGPSSTPHLPTSTTTVTFSTSNVPTSATTSTTTAYAASVITTTVSATTTSLAATTTTTIFPTAISPSPRPKNSLHTLLLRSNQTPPRRRSPTSTTTHLLRCPSTPHSMLPPMACSTCGYV